METKTRLSRSRFLKLASVAAAGTALAACAAPSSPAGPTEVPKSAASEPVTLEYWFCWPGVYQEKQRKILDAFEKESGKIKVHDLTIPSNIRQKMLTSVAAGTPPDAANCFGDVVTLAANGGLMSIDEYVKASKIMKLDALYKSRVDSTFWNGKQWGLPYNCSAELLLCNRTLFEGAGLNPENQIGSWAEFTEASKKMVKFDDAGNLQIAAFTGFVPRHPSMWFWINGSDAYDATSNKITIDLPANVEGLQTVIDYAWNVYGDITKADAFNSGAGTGVDGPFCTNTLAMEIGGDWQPTTNNEWCPGLKQWPMMFPKGPKGKAPIAAGAGDFIAILRGAPHADESYQFIEWMVMKGNKMWTEAGVDTNCVIADAGFVRSDWPAIFGDKAAEIAKWWAQAAADSVPVENFPAYGFMKSELTRVMDLAFHKKMTADEALKEAQGTVQEEMDKYTVP